MKFKFIHKAMIAIFLTFFISTILPISLKAAAAGPINKKPSVAVLCYHHITTIEIPPQATTKAVVPLEEFEAQMKYLYEQGYYTASLKDLEDFLYNNKELPKKTVVITFDDGYESNYINAFPVLQKYDFKATIFLVGSDVVEKAAPYDPHRLSILSYDQIRKMQDSGLIEFGNHSFDAHKYNGSKPALLTMNRESIIKDFEKQQKLFSKIGIPSFTSIAHPFGRYNNTVIDAAKKTGHKLGFTIQDGLVYKNSSPFALNRIVVPAGVTPQEFRTLLRDDSLCLPTGFEDSLVLDIDSNVAYVKGKAQLLEASPFIEGGRTMVPLRFLAENLGGKVHWTPGTNKVSLSSLDRTVELDIEPMYPNIVQDRVMVPLRFLSETLGFQVKWHEDRRMVEIRGY